MTQDPNARSEVEPTEIGANAAETGERPVYALYQGGYFIGGDRVVGNIGHHDIRGEGNQRFGMIVLNFDHCEPPL